MQPRLRGIEVKLEFSLQLADARHRHLLTRAFVGRCLRAAFEGPAHITVRVVGQAEGQRLNRDYRGRDYATDVLTFEYATQPVVMADLVLCAPVVARQARELGLPLLHHYAHLLVHGALHAQGWEHEDDEEQAADMEALEAFLLSTLGVDDPYFSPRNSRAASRAK